MIQFVKKSTDFLFGFNDDEKKLLNSIEKERSIYPDFITWANITIALPLLTFIISIAINFLLAPDGCFIYNNWSKFVLNGSLPIISFGIISSGVSYLMEDLKDAYPDAQSIRRRVMGIAIMFLFLCSALYIFQSISFLSDRLELLRNLILLVVTLVVCLFSISIGFKMYLLQKSNIDAFGKTLSEDLQKHSQSLEESYTNGD